MDYSSLKPFCIKCGAEFTDDTPFCTNCGAKREVPTAAPSFSAPVPPVYHPPVPPVPPVYYPSAPAQPVHKHRFPAAPLVFVIMAMLCTFIYAFVIYRTGFNNPSFFINLTAYTLMIVGLAVHKGRVSPMFGIAVLLLALYRMYTPIMNIIEASDSYYGYYSYYNEEYILMQVLYLLPAFFMLIAGISYLVPATAMRVLKVIFTIFSIVLELLTVIIDSTQTLYVATGVYLLGYLFITLPELLALLTYSPSKEA